MCKPRPSAHDLDHHAPVYIDCYVALDLLHMRYPAYIAATTPQERLLYRLYAALKSAKEQHVMERMQQESDAQRMATQATVPLHGRP